MDGKIDRNDIELVAMRTEVSDEKAKCALEMAGGDLADAVDQIDTILYHLREKFDLTSVEQVGNKLLQKDVRSSVAMSTSL